MKNKIYNKVIKFRGEQDRIKKWTRLTLDISFVRIWHEQASDVAPDDLNHHLKASHHTNENWREDLEWYQEMLKIPQVGRMT